MANQFAPPGTIYVCAACGKTSDNLYGDGAKGWDESCMLHAVLCEDKKRFDPMGVYGWVRSGAVPMPWRNGEAPVLSLDGSAPLEIKTTYERVKEAEEKARACSRRAG